MVDDEKDFDDVWAFYSRYGGEEPYVRRRRNSQEAAEKNSSEMMLNTLNRSVSEGLESNSGRITDSYN